MLRVGETIFDTDVAFNVLRVKMAETVLRRLRRAADAYPEFARTFALGLGIRPDRPDYATGPRGWQWQRRGYPGTPHYVDSFEATVESNGEDFPITFVATNTSPIAGIIEGGARPHVIRSKRRGGKLVFPVGAAANAASFGQEDLRKRASVRHPGQPTAYRALERSATQAVLRSAR
jgi:hypothetical protein